MRIVKLEAENVKRLSAVEIQPDGSLVVVSGRNGAGKSSVLDAIEMALAGASSIPSVPIRRGQEKARVRLDLGELVVERVFSNGDSRLTVKSADGATYPSPQKILDGLCSHVAFDPLEFSRLKPREQAEQLRALVGIDFTALDAERKKAYDERAAVNRQVAQAKALVASMPWHNDAPKEEVSVKSLADELERREKVNVDNTLKRQAFDESNEAVGCGESAVKDAEAEITQLEQSLAKAKADLLVRQEELADRRRIQHKAAEVVDALRDADTAEVKQQIRDAESINSKVRDNAARTRQAARYAELSDEAAGFTEILDDIDRQKREALEKAAFPVDGLGFTDSGVTYNGLPFEQASSAERLRVSAAMGVARNPKLRIMLVRDGSLLDPDGWTLLAKMAEDSNFQVWVETCNPNAPASVIIVDGQAVHPAEAEQELEAAT